MQNNKRLSTKLNKHFGDKIELTFVYEIDFDRIVLIVTKDDKVYKYNSVISAELGSRDDNCSSEIKSAIVEQLCGKQIVDFAYGQHYAIARTKDGKIYSWLNYITYEHEYNQNLIKPVLNQYFEDKSLKIKDIKSGSYFTLALTQEGEVYTWGWNSGGFQTIPFRLNFYSVKIDMISCGARYSIGLNLESGRLYYWKSHEYGQSFKNTRIGCNIPKLNCQYRIKFTKISCGKNHSLLLSDKGYLYAYGSNYWGQIGNGSPSESMKIFKPIKVKLPEKIKDIATHYTLNISAALSVNNNLYVWGQCGEEVFITPEVTQLKSFKNVFAEYYRITFEAVKGNLDIDDTFIYNGRYEKRFNQLREIGRGGFGIVYEVKDKFGYKKYAVKIVDSKDSSEKDLLKEFKISSLLRKHDERYIVRFISSWIENNCSEENGYKKFDGSISLYIQMELCLKTLDDIITEINYNSVLKANGILTIIGYYFASQLFIEILECVDYLHTQNPQIIHRDLKPDNILLTNPMDGRFVRITDFGLVTVHKYENQSHTRDVGNLSYAAPEVLNGTKYSTNSDVYSLGIVLQKLFFIHSERNLNEYNISEPLLKSKYGHLIQLSRRMTTIEPTERPNCRQIFNHRIFWAINRKDFNHSFDMKTNVVNDLIYTVIKSKYQ